MVADLLVGHVPQRRVFYFLTEDLNNRKERNEIEFLRTLGHVVLVTRGAPRTRINGVRQLRLPAQSARAARAHTIWLKICYVLARLAHSAADKEFPRRNLYSGHRLVRSLVNLLWRVKTIGWLNRLLPSYDRLYFFPFACGIALSRPGRRRRSSHVERVFVHESLVLRLAKFSGLIAYARRAGMRTIANVKSWDNPFYSQFSAGADGFLVWSASMWEDIRHAQAVPPKPVHVWGARPFFDFAHAVAQSPLRPATGNGAPVVGYAAAFCDSVMVKHELAVIRAVATALARRLPEATILFRPYPSQPTSAYHGLADCPNIRVMDIHGEIVDRYNDGREFIRFGSDEERLQYLAGCSCFLSMATSFTIEAAMFGLPIVHFYLAPEDCRTHDESMFFERIRISDHLDKYFNGRLLLARDYAPLIELIASAASSEALARGRTLIWQLGIPETIAGWQTPAATLARDLRLRTAD